MSNHALMHVTYQLTACLLTQKWEKRMHKGRKRPNAEAPAKAQRSAHVLEIGFIHALGVTGELLNHRVAQIT